MRLRQEEEILDINFRSTVIKEIEAPENQARKDSMKKRYDIFKDDTKKYVLEMMENESSDKTVVAEVINRAANISFARKIIDKKAQVYKDGVTREVLEDETSQAQLDSIVDITNFNSTMKKTNKYAELFKNALVQVMPYTDAATGKYKYKSRVLQPYLYDVIEDADNPEDARVYIFSYMSNDNGPGYANVGESGYHDGDNKQSFRNGNGVNEIIADSPNDAGGEHTEYVWWSNKFHFTTDDKGNILPGKQDEKLLNPIGMLPFCNFSMDQDGNFWAVGGEDIIDGAILLDILLTDLFYIARYQGMGIGYLFGKGVPQNMKVGPSAFITLDMEDGDPTPQMGFATSSPPIQDHLSMIETYVAYLLSSNNLEIGSVQSKLSATGTSSGIQEMVKRAENMDDIQDQREMYRDGEPCLFRIMAKWHNLYLGKNLLSEPLASVGKLNEDMNIRLRFADPQPFITEKERLEIIEKRLAIGLDSMIDAVKRDNPDISEEEAKEKIRVAMETKLKESSERLKQFGNQEVEEEDDDMETEE